VNKSEKRPLNPIFYLDENLGGNKITSILRAAGISIVVYKEHFEPGTADETWLPTIGKNGWVLLTQDSRIRRRKNEIQALRDYDVRAFVISAKGLMGQQIGELILSSMPKMLRILKNTKPPFVALVNRDSVITLKEGQHKKVSYR